MFKELFKKNKLHFLILGSVLLSFLWYVPFKVMLEMFRVVGIISVVLGIIGLVFWSMWRIVETVLEYKEREEDYDDNR